MTMTKSKWEGWEAFAFSSVATRSGYLTAVSVWVGVFLVLYRGMLSSGSRLVGHSVLLYLWSVVRKLLKFHYDDTRVTEIGDLYFEFIVNWY